jgi:hypothetical protein
VQPSEAASASSLRRSGPSPAKISSAQAGDSLLARATARIAISNCFTGTCRPTARSRKGSAVCLAQRFGSDQRSETATQYGKLAIFSRGIPKLAR